jgi:uncharacterized coiled-coil DUF342 family protein|tara:strand:- start:128 stop:532 length:405 start_codon:yes stop_codon:yes gene_type:complete
MEEQIKEQYEKAFWDLIDQEPPNMEHIGKLLDEIKQILYSFVPHRADLHHKINNDLSGEIAWDFQHKLLAWIEKFQAPIYDQFTQSWRRRVPQKLSEFLKKYYEHLKQIRKEIDGYHQKPDGTNGVPSVIKTGR